MLKESGVLAPPLKSIYPRALGIGFILLFLVVGAVGHDPWKQDETYSFGVIYHFYLTQDWLIPMNAGAPFMEKPPLYYWTAALICRLFGGLISLPDAARLTSVFYMALASLSLWYTAWILFRNYSERRAMGYIALALFLGSFGVLRHAHDMFTDVALLAGVSFAYLGMVVLIVMQRQWIMASVIIGLGLGIAFLSKGLGVPIILGLSGILLLVLFPELKFKKAMMALLVVIGAASPFLFPWPYLLYHASPDLFMEWFWDNNVGRFLGFSVDQLGASNSHGYMAGAILWFAFPVFPLACVAWAVKRRQWLRPELLIPSTVCLAGAVILLSSASARALYLLPLIPMLSLLAAQGLMQIPLRWHARWNLCVRIVATIIALWVISLWICLMHPAGPQPFAPIVGNWLVAGLMPQGQTLSYVVACLFLGIWIISFRVNARSYAGTAVIWFCAVALLWGLGNTLLLPWVNETRSFRPVIEEINTVMAAPAYKNACIARNNLGESFSPMWEYYGKGRGMGPLEDFSGTRCPLLLTMSGKKMLPLSNPRWHLVWKGSRILDDKDELMIFERNR